MVNNGSMSMKFTEQGLSTSGDKERALIIPSDFTRNRKDCEQSIYALALSENKTPQQVAAQILNGSIDELARYAQLHGEKPCEDTGTLCIQGVLLRIKNLAKIAATLDCTDGQAILELEEADGDAIKNGLADGDMLLSPAAAAAVNILTEDIKAKCGTYNNFVSAVNMFEDSTASSIARNFVIPDHLPAGSPSPGGTHLGNISYPDNATGIVGDEPWWGDTGGGSPSSTSSGSWLDKLLGTIGKIGDTIGKVGGQIGQAGQQVGGAIGGIGGQVTDVGSDIGAASIDKVLKKYLPFIILIFVIIIIAIIYAKRK